MGMEYSIPMFFLFTRGRRAFSIAAILMLLTTVAHTLGNIQPVTDPDERVLITQMAAFQLPLGLNMSPSFWDIYQYLIFTMSITMMGLGLVNLALAMSRDAAPALLRRVSWMNLIWVAAFTLLSGLFQIPHALISGTLILLAVLVSL